MADDVVIDRIAEETTLDTSGKSTSSIRVTFHVGADGPFYKVYKRDAWNPSSVRHELEDFARELKQLRP